MSLYIELDGAPFPYPPECEPRSHKAGVEICWTGVRVGSREPRRNYRALCLDCIWAGRWRYSREEAMQDRFEHENRLD